MRIATRMKRIVVEPVMTQRSLCSPRRSCTTRTTCAVSDAAPNSTSRARVSRISLSGARSESAAIDGWSAAAPQRM